MHSIPHFSEAVWTGWFCWGMVARRCKPTPRTTPVGVAAAMSTKDSSSRISRGWADNAVCVRQGSKLAEEPAS
ncbi:uncharacterized protein N7458_005859 [Penicillium daleae]|uniref:Uncharacterized protein n=1 Tax=Penicillium daleae TaxID=63821 RepID=A0AAD6G2C2_9EURO|nr:uncharacterized protein N7458_005859 [Penicillium daleae]KAJ5449410.1 hypothetical protein N7458_005859 [Penicillium daleae]